MNIEQLLLMRRTAKVLADPVSPMEPVSVDRKMIDQMISAAGNAPFHYPCAASHRTTLGSPVPWRVYKLDGVRCRSLTKLLVGLGDKTKIPNLLAAADFLFQVTWLPDEQTNAVDQFSPPMEEFPGTLGNMEHIAAASAMIQSLLLAATQAGFLTYWSSGGKLRSPELFEWLDMPAGEILLGSVFLFPGDAGDVEIIPGKLRERRGKLIDWSVWRD